MTPEEIKAAAKEGTQEAIEESKTAFYISDQQHYEHHRFIEKAIEFFDGSKKTIWKTFLRLIVYGLLFLLMLGLGTHFFFPKGQ